MTLVQLYKNSFKGLRSEVWWLALVTLINRAGTMVLPFLSLYLTAELKFTLQDVAWVMSAFGLGSVCGAWLGGKLVDKIGYYQVMFNSLFFSGLLFICLQYVQSFAGFCAFIFVLLLVADTFRPAAQVAISTYSKPENRTRSVTLIRLAINLGFSAGPAAAGLIIIAVGYEWLFWIDGITCIAAAFTFLYLLKPKKAIKKEKVKTKELLASPYKDKAFWVFLIALFLIGVVFLQLFTTLPLYYRDFYHLTEGEIGWLFAINGILIFALEMPLIKYFENDKFSTYKILIGSAFLFALSFLIFNTVEWSGILVISMLLLTLAEMLNFPFANTFALNRSYGKQQGAYMSLFTMVFAVAHIAGQNVGVQLVEHYGFTTTWYVMTGLGCFGALCLLWLKYIMKKEEALAGLTTN